MTEETMSCPLICQASVGVKGVNMTADFESPLLGRSSCLEKESKEDISMHPTCLNPSSSVL